MFKGRFAEEEFDDIVYVNDLSEIEDALFQLNITGQALLVTGSGPTRYIGEQAGKEMHHHKIVGHLESREASWGEAKRIASEAERLGADILFCASGGRGLMSPKLTTELIDIPLVYIPTSVASDGIDSNQVSFKVNGIPKSVIVSPYSKVIVRKVLYDAPVEHALGGDIIAKLSSVRDWKHAYDIGKEKKVPYDEEIGNTLMMYAYTILLDHFIIKESGVPLNRGHRMYKKLVEDVLEASIVAGRIGSKLKSSRPISGSEHLIAHAIELIYDKLQEENPILHHRGCGWGTILSLDLHNKKYSSPYSRNLINLVKSVYDLRAMPDHVKMSLLPIAKQIGEERKRYTILDEFDFDEDSSRKILASNGLIETNKRNKIVLNSARFLEEYAMTTLLNSKYI